MTTSERTLPASANSVLEGDLPIRRFSASITLFQTEWTAPGTIRASMMTPESSTETTAATLRREIESALRLPSFTNEVFVPGGRAGNRIRVRSSSPVAIVA